MTSVSPAAMSSALANTTNVWACPAELFDTPPATPPALKPPLKWAGGKRWLVPYLQSLWAAHDHRRLVEPFCGGLAITLGLEPQRAWLNDLNLSLIHFYRWVQRGLTISVPMVNDELLY